MLFHKGFRHLFQDAKEIRRIQTRVLTSNIGYENLPYRELEKLRQVGEILVKNIRTDVSEIFLYCLSDVC